MIFRFAKAEDVQTIALMNQSLIRDEGHRNRMTLEELEARMGGWLAGSYRAILFEYDDGQLVGYALYRDEPDFIYVRQFYVRQENRRSGIGREAWEWMKSFAWSSDRRVRIDVLVGNKNAMDFWHALGFQTYCMTMEFEGTQGS